MQRPDIAATHQTIDDGQIATGGRNIYGVPVGILMLDTSFPRISGDVGHAGTWPFPVAYGIVGDASPQAIVRELSVEAWLEPFIREARKLEASGVELITTGCGFLVLFQQQLQAALDVPVLTSSLLQIPWLEAILPPRQRIGVLTIEARSLTEHHLQAAGITDSRRLTIQGLDDAGGYFTSQLLEDRSELDVARCRDEHERAASRLIERDPDVGVIVLECTNMPPYADDIRNATGRPVYDLTTLVRWAVTGLRPSVS